MTAPVFVDTNVIVYRFDTTDPRKQSRAVDWFTFIWNCRSGRVSFQVLQEAYAVLTRKRKPADAQRIVRGLAAWQPVTIEDRHLELVEEPGPALKRRVDLAAEDVVIACDETQGRKCGRVEKIGSDIRSLAPPDLQTGYRDPVAGVRRIEVKDRKRGQPVRLTTNEWFKARKLGDTYWLYVVWDPLDDPDPTPLMIRNPAEASRLRQARDRRRPVL